MKTTKSNIKGKIANGKIEQAIGFAQEYASFCGLNDILGELTILNGLYNKHESNWKKGLLSYEDFSINTAKIMNSLTSIVDRLPDVPIIPRKKKAPLTDSTFKRRVFWAICIIKAFVLIRLFRNYSTGGYNDFQFMNVIGILLPAFFAYVTVMVDDLIKKSKTSEAKQKKYLSGSLVSFAYILFPIYAVALIAVIELKAATSISFEQMTFWIAMVESSLGVYIGKIISAFFKNE